MALLGLTIALPAVASTPMRLCVDDDGQGAPDDYMYASCQSFDGIPICHYDNKAGTIDCDFESAGYDRIPEGYAITFNTDFTTVFGVGEYGSSTETFCCEHKNGYGSEGALTKTTLRGTTGEDRLNHRYSESGVTYNLTGDNASSLPMEAFIYGDASDDGIQGSDANSVKESLHGGDDVDTIHGGDGDDTLVGNAGGDFLFGEGGDDDLNGGPGIDKLRGNDGHDSISGGTEKDYIWGGPGNDVLRGDAGDDEIKGQDGADTLYGHAGHDHLWGDDGPDHLYGGNGTDTLEGGDDRDILHGNANGNTPNDEVLDGGLGNDDLYGGNGPDLLEGGFGNDRLWGGDGIDLLDGGPNNDQLYGGKGEDELLGGDDDDFLCEQDFGVSGSVQDFRGGTGVDTLVYRRAGSTIGIQDGDFGMTSVYSEGTPLGRFYYVLDLMTGTLYDGSGANNAVPECNEMF